MQAVYTFEEMEQAIPYMGRKVFKYVQEMQTESFEGFDDYILFAFDWYDIHSIRTQGSKVVAYLDRENLIFFCEDAESRNYITGVFKALTDPEPMENHRLVYRFFMYLLRDDMDTLDEYEDRINDSEGSVLDDEQHRDLLQKIALWRRELLQLKHYYEQLDTIFDEISMCDTGLLPPEAMNRLTILGRRTDRYLSKVCSLQERVSQLREAYQSQLSIQQNDLMKVFTIVTTVFLPLTLLAGWYGMNFTYMPELDWRWGYPVLIVVSVAIVAGLFWYFKHKKIL